MSDGTLALQLCLATPLVSEPRVVHSVRGEYLVVIDHVNSPQEILAIQRWQLWARTSPRHSVGTESRSAPGSTAPP